MKFNNAVLHNYCALIFSYNVVNYFTILSGHRNFLMYRWKKKYKIFGRKAINHLTKCFAYKVKGTDDEDTLKNLTAISLHVFWDHSQ